MTSFIIKRFISFIIKRFIIKRSAMNKGLPKPWPYFPASLLYFLLLNSSSGKIFVYLNINYYYCNVNSINTDIYFINLLTYYVSSIMYYINIVIDYNKRYILIIILMIYNINKT